VLREGLLSRDYIIDLIDIPGGAKFLIIDEDSIDNGDEPFTTEECYQYLNPLSWSPDPGSTFTGCGLFGESSNWDFDTSTPINDDIADKGVRDVLPYFSNIPEPNVGRIIELQTGHITDEGWFAPNFIPESWCNNQKCAGLSEEEKAAEGFGNFYAATNGLGTGDDPEKFLDKISDVRPIRYQGLLGLVDMTICAVVYDSDISIDYLPEDDFSLNKIVGGGVFSANLQGANLGVVAFKVIEVIEFGGPATANIAEQGHDDPQEIAKVKIEILNADDTCQNLIKYEAPRIVDENTSALEDDTLCDYDTGFLGDGGDENACYSIP